MKDLKNKTVLITGGASGIGKIMTRLMLERGAKVIIWDINQSSIDATISEFHNIDNPHGYNTNAYETYGYNVDVSNIKSIEEAAKKVKEEIGIVDVVINNAGIVVGKYFHEHSIAEIDKTIEINASAPMYITHAFLKDMFEQNSGHICNIASLGGIISNPKMSVYAASKWAVFGWSDSLRIEMKQLNKNIHITTVLPYYINTGMFDGVKSRIPILDPEKAALKIIKAIEKNQKILTIPGYLYRLTRFGQAILSISVFDWFVGNVLGIYKTMDNFIGRK